MSIIAKNQGTAGAEHSSLDVRKYAPGQLQIRIHALRQGRDVVLNKKSVRDLAKKLLAWAGDDCEESSVSGDL